MNINDVVVKSQNIFKSFCTSLTKAELCSMVNTDNVVAKSSNSDKSFFTTQTREAKYTTVNTVDVVSKQRQKISYISNKGCKTNHSKGSNKKNVPNFEDQALVISEKPKD